MMSLKKAYGVAAVIEHEGHAGKGLSKQHAGEDHAPS